jgi:hypothetical protein
VWEQGCGSNVCDGLLELTVWGQDGGCNGCDGFLELSVRRKAVEVMVLMVSLS